MELSLQNRLQIKELIIRIVTVNVIRKPIDETKQGTNFFASLQNQSFGGLTP